MVWRGGRTVRDVAFGQYYPVASPVHRLDARLKILFTLLYVVTMFFVASYTAYAVILIFLLSVCAIARIPVSAMFKSIKGILILLIITSILNLFFYGGETSVVWQWWIFKVSPEAIDSALKLMFRLILLIMGTTMLTFTTGATELTDAIESLLKPLNLIKVPVRDIAIIMSIALRFIPILIDETDKITMAQKSRGADFDSGNIFKRAKALLPVLIPLFVGAFRKADELADALDARCYNASPKRTRMKKMKFAPRDLVAFLIMSAVCVFIFLDKYLIGGADGYVVQAFNAVIDFFKGL
ncbi:MAG: energy-coupling factor transporter transmembrane protein EcfT [Clostridia bacterium]|nr:energy-coupling factor transporter transmembrane protein EcfT [Clostridia bacterium]